MENYYEKFAGRKRELWVNQLSETGVLSHKPNSRGSIHQVLPLTPTCQIKRQIVVKDRERRLITQHRCITGRGKESASTHVQSRSISFWVK
jgi:hypothetical protein